LYALLMRFGVPVREEICGRCGGTGTVEKNGPHPDEYDSHHWCPDCTTSRTAVKGTGVIETPEPLSLATGVNRFDLEFVYPGIEDREGRMVRRPVTLDRLELAEYRSSLEALVHRVAAAESSGDWPAVVSDAACSECPAPGECPIPREVRDWRGRINTPEQAADAARVLDRQKAELRAAQTELRNFAKVSGESIRFDGKVMELIYTESETMDWRAFLAAPDDADPQDYVSTKGRTDFKARDLTADEMEGQDG
jgi:hypothetical protein